MKVHNPIAVSLAFVILFLLTVVSVYQIFFPAYDVVIQAGHEGRVEGNTGAQGRYGKESEWNVIVANATADALRQKGYRVKRVGADLPFLRSKVAVAIHFDGSMKPCSSGASVGYRDQRDTAFARRWKERYERFFPFKWHADNFTENLQNYYGYFWIKAQRFLVLELGEITCDKQAQWLKPRLKKIARIVAESIERELKEL